jgi:presequence protease
MLASYRDPNLEKTLDAFDGIGEYLENLELSEAELEKLIIGTIGRMDSPLTSSQKGKLALTRYLTGVDEDELNKHRKELLTSTLSDLKNYSKLFYEFSRHGIICVHGSQKRLNESKDLFDEVVAVIN